MNKLSNTVIINGSYHNIPTLLTSNTLTISIQDALTITKSADKNTWHEGNLTYTITIDNKNNRSYKNSKITNIINTKLVSLIPNSIKINNIPAKDNEYSYNTALNTLTIYLDTITSNSKTIISFSIKKNYNDYFVLKTNCLLTYQNNIEKQSNYVTVISPLKRPTFITNSCSTPYWRY